MRGSLSTEWCSHDKLCAGCRLPIKFRSVYTPQMVVDGTAEFVGSNSRSADEAFAKALRVPKIPVRVSSITFEPMNMKSKDPSTPDGSSSQSVLRARVETDALPDSFGAHEGEVYVAVALNRGESQVSRGENDGRRLAHTAVVRNFVKVGTVQVGHSFAKDVQLKLETGANPNNL